MRLSPRHQVVPLLLVGASLTILVPSTWGGGDQHHGSSSLLASGQLAKGESWSATFNETGTFTYHCHPHPTMKGTVIVDSGATTNGTVNVTIEAFAFHPSNVTVSPGTRIEWMNRDSDMHTVTYDATASAHSNGLPAWTLFIVLGALVAAGSLLVLRRIR